jgi:hypothetical protein
MLKGLTNSQYYLQGRIKSLAALKMSESFPQNMQPTEKHGNQKKCPFFFFYCYYHHHHHYNHHHHHDNGMNHVKKSMGFTSHIYWLFKGITCQNEFPKQ